MASYRAMRNPDGVRVGETWYAKRPKANYQSKIEITSVFGNLICVENERGQPFQINAEYLKKHYSIQNHSDLFGELS